jgi:hypothetical protein
MNFRIVAGRPVSDHLYAEAHTAIDTGERRRSSDWSPEKVVFWVCVVLFAIALAGCATPTPEERAETMIARHAPLCERLGFATRSPMWAGCIMERERQRTSGVVCVTVGATVMCD